MNWGGAYVVAGYLGQVLICGWRGLLAGALHLGLLLLCVWLKK